jgi:hypothetical protein
MGKGGRPSNQELLIRDRELERIERPRPPFDLHDEECVVWAEVVNSMPSDWFTPGSAPLLTQYCRHTVQSRRIAAMIEKATGDPELELIDHARLLRMQAVETNTLALLATKLRLSQQSIKKGTGATVFDRTGGVRRPWEI